MKLNNKKFNEAFKLMVFTGLISSCSSKIIIQTNLKQFLNKDKTNNSMQLNNEKC